MKIITVNKKENLFMNQQQALPLLGKNFLNGCNDNNGKLSLPDAYKGKWWVLFSHR